MPNRTRLAPLLLVTLASCSRPKSDTDPPDASPAVESPRYGAVMAEIGHRFELAGRAMNAGRYELAAFEIGELEEAFAGDLPRAEVPKEGPSAQLPTMAKEFLDTHPPALAKAAEAKDAAAFAAAFARAAEACNACHAASEHGFIEVPAVTGKGVPDLEPKVAPSASN